MGKPASLLNLEFPHLCSLNGQIVRLLSCQDHGSAFHVGGKLLVGTVINLNPPAGVSFLVVVVSAG